jgi:putative ABC transport system permease protein
VLVGIVALLVLGQGAVFAPARRASRVSPVEATRSV